MVYPEGGELVKWPEIMHLVNKRYASFVNEDLAASKASINVVFCHANLPQALPSIFYKDGFENVDGWYFMDGIDYSCISIYTYTGK